MMFDLRCQSFVSHFLLGSNRFSPLHRFVLPNAYTHTHTHTRASDAPIGQRPSVLISNKVENAEKKKKTKRFSYRLLRNDWKWPMAHRCDSIQWFYHIEKNTREQWNARPWIGRRKTFHTTWRRSVRRKQSPPKIGLVVACSATFGGRCWFHQDSISQTYGASRKYNRYHGSYGVCLFWGMWRPATGIMCFRMAVFYFFVADGISRSPLSKLGLFSKSTNQRQIIYIS